MAELELNPDIVCLIIARAHEFHAQEQVVIPEEPANPTQDWALEVLADHAGDPSYLELKTIIEELEPDQQVTLVALMWMGRGDYDASEWDTALEEAGDSWTPRAADYLIATPLVADYLEEGLSELGYSCED